MLSVQSHTSCLQWFVLSVKALSSIQTGSQCEAENLASAQGVNWNANSVHLKSSVLCCSCWYGNRHNCNSKRWGKINIGKPSKGQWSHVTQSCSQMWQIGMFEGCRGITNEEMPPRKCKSHTPTLLSLVAADFLQGLSYLSMIWITLIVYV